jgi:hypothetical protein
VTAAATSTIFVNKCNVGKYNIILSLLNIQWLGWDGNFSKKEKRRVMYHGRKRKKKVTNIHPLFRFVDSSHRCDFNQK